jgi:GT2 family glycosyltransferase
MNGKTDNLVSVIVVTKGAGNYLPKCLQSIKAQSYSLVQVIVIDNSLDESFAQNICHNFPWAQVLRSPANLFYAASLNTGIGLSKGEFILCLNDDVYLDKEFINEALKGFFLREDIGMISGKILRKDKKTVDSTELYLSIFRTAKERGYGKQDIGQFEKESFIFGPSGAAAFYRKKMLDEIREGEEYFDSNLAMFYEDIDIAWRANISGWKGYYMPKAIAYHARGGSFRPDSGLGKPIARRYLDDNLYAGLIRNRYSVIIKNENIFDLILRIMPLLLYDLCMWVYTAVLHRKAAKIFFCDMNFFYRAKQKRNARLCQHN